MANRYYLDETRYPRTGNCIFISYHYSDRDAAKQIANYISQSEMDIYFDEYNTHIGGGDFIKSIKYIKAGIRRSSHMLCVLSQTALRSHLMPWEIGYGYDLLQVVGLTIKELSKSELPEYLQVVPILRGTKTLNTFIANTVGRVADSLIREQKLFSASDMNHPSIIYLIGNFSILKNNLRMNKNLAVYMLFHTSNEHGKKTYEAIYKLLCRDADHPFEDGLDIPVYLRMGDDDEHKVIKTIDPKASDKTYILLLIDDNMYCSEVWSEYVKQLISIRDANKGTFIINCVEQSKFALDFNKSLARDQFIRLNSYSLLENWQEFQIRLFDNLIRFIKLKDRTKKLKIFISHSKRDENKIGLLKAIEFRDYIRSQTKLDSFFDASDILDGENAQDQIKKNEEGIQSLIVILNSNTYSEREWCQKEVLFAKESKIPTIAVSLLDGEVKRSFPYISNIPYIRYDNNWGDILVLILRTALDQYCQAEYLENLRLGLEKDKRDSYAVLPFSPEAYSFVYKELQKNILYPEPPLTKDELNVVKTIAGVEKQFLTPMQLLAETINLARKSVAVSVSEAPGSYSIGYGKAMIRDLTIELSRHLLIAGARMVYGGDLRSEGFTELFSELSLQYKNYQSEVDREEFFFTNYFAWPIWLNLTNEHKLQFVNSRVKYKTVEPPEDYMGDPSKPIAPINNENTLVWAKSLRKMRMEMESHVDARIILGGKIQGFKGYMAGLAEEFVQSFRAGHPVYLLGGFGGTAAMLADILQGKADVSALVNASRKNKPYNDFFEYCKSKGIDMGYAELEDIVKAGGLDVLDNGLSREKNMSLLTSTDVIEIVGLILEGLRNKFNKSISNDEK